MAARREPSSGAIRLHSGCMALQVEAIFENGVLRPLAPLMLKDRRHVRITVDEGASREEAPAVFNPRYAEMQWIPENAGQYIGEWLALDGARLVSHGATLNEGDAEARARGVEEPLFYHVPRDWDQPSDGGLWL